jgi:hypothetical protein
LQPPYPTLPFGLDKKFRIPPNPLGLGLREEGLHGQPKGWQHKPSRHWANPSRFFQGDLMKNQSGSIASVDRNMLPRSADSCTTSCPKARPVAKLMSRLGETPNSICVQGEKSIWISGSLSGSQQHGRSTRYSPLIRTRRLRVIDGHQRVGNSDRWVDALPQSPLDPQCDVRRKASNAVEHQRPIAPVLWHGFQLRGVQLFTSTRSFAPLASPPEALPEA